MTNTKKIMCLILAIVVAVIAGISYYISTNKNHLLPGTEKLGITDMQFLACGKAMQEDKPPSDEKLLACLKKHNPKLTLSDVSQVMNKDSK